MLILLFRRERQHFGHTLKKTQGQMPFQPRPFLPFTRRTRRKVLEQAHRHLHYGGIHQPDLQLLHHQRIGLPRQVLPQLRKGA